MFSRSRMAYLIHSHCTTTTAAKATIIMTNRDLNINFLIIAVQNSRRKSTIYSPRIKIRSHPNSIIYQKGCLSAPQKQLSNKNGKTKPHAWFFSYCIFSAVVLYKLLSLFTTLIALNKRFCKSVLSCNSSCKRIKDNSWVGLALIRSRT